MEKQLGHDTENPLSRQVKRLNFGQFLFLYFVLRNKQNLEFSIKLLEELKCKGVPEWAKTKGQKAKDKKIEEIKLKQMDSDRKGSGPPSYKNSMSNIPAESKEEPQAPPLEQKSGPGGWTSPGIIQHYPELSNYQEDATMKKK